MNTPAGKLAFAYATITNMQQRIDELEAQIADKLPDAAMLEWVLQDAYVCQGFTNRGVVLEIAGTDREVPRPGNWGQEPYPVRTAIAAAMLASKVVKP